VAGCEVIIGAVHQSYIATGAQAWYPRPGELTMYRAQEREEISGFASPVEQTRLARHFDAQSAAMRKGHRLIVSADMRLRASGLHPPQSVYSEIFSPQGNRKLAPWYLARYHSCGGGGADGEVREDS
jgi:hypothetical protein